MQNVVNYDNHEQFYDKISITNANIIKKHFLLFFTLRIPVGAVSYIDKIATRHPQLVYSGIFSEAFAYQNSKK